MGIERAIEHDEYGRTRYILNSDKIIKIGDKLLQVRLIQIEQWNDRSKLTHPMPRAKFITTPEANPYYLIRKSDFEKLKENKA